MRILSLLPVGLNSHPSRLNCHCYVTSKPLKNSPIVIGLSFVSHFLPHTVEGQLHCLLVVEMKGIVNLSSVFYTPAAPLDSCLLCKRVMIW